MKSCSTAPSQLLSGGALVGVGVIVAADRAAEGRPQAAGPSAIQSELEEDLMAPAKAASVVKLKVLATAEPAT